MENTMNGFDDFDTTITAEEFYESDYLDMVEEAPGDTTDEPPYGHDLDGYEYAGFDG